MKSATLVVLIIMSTFTSLIAISQNSLAEQNSSQKPKIEKITLNTTSSSSQNSEIRATDLKQKEKQKMEFKDNLITGITFPEGDAAAKSEPNSSAASAAMKNIKK